MWRGTDLASDQSGSWQDAALDQLQVWRRNLAIHTGLVLLLALVALIPAVGEERLQVAAYIALVGVPWSVGMQWWFERTGRLPLLLPFGDALLPCIVVVLAPQLLAPSLVVLTAACAVAAMGYGARIGLLAAMTGTIGMGLAALSNDISGWGVAVVIYGMTSGAIAFALGTMSESERDLRRRHVELTSGIDAIVWEQVEAKPNRLYVNQRATDLLGYPAAAFLEPGFWRSKVHPDDVDEVRRRYRDAVRRGQNLEVDYRLVAADGRIVHLQDRMRVEVDELGRPVHVRGVMVDVTGRREAEAQARRYLDLVDSIQLALVVLTPDPADPESLVVMDANPEAAAVLSTRPGESSGRTLHDIVAAPGIEAIEEQLLAVADGGDPVVIDELRLGPGGRGGRVYTAYGFPLPGGSVGLSLHDITERVMAADVLRRQALHDALTGLPNRTRLTERLRAVIDDTPEDGHCALLLMDLDQFKDVNDALGHDQGDRLLVEVSRRLQKVVRNADTIARLGGDEYAVLLADAGVDEARKVADYIRQVLEQPFVLGGISIQTNASVGIAVHPEHAADAELLVQRADVAMYAAKRGRRGLEVYAPEHDQSSVRRLALLGELRQAIDDDQMRLFFQPTLDLRAGRVVGCEALVRWEHPEHGLMPPGEFIELAEVSGLIQPLTRWVVDTALAQIATWQAADRELTVSVNLSVRNLYDRDLVQWLSERIEHHQVPAQRIKIEITESELMDDPMLAMDILGRITAMGSSTSIDDFGTGYSSLSYLKHLAIDELKIDKSFVATMCSDDSDLTIVRSTIDLAHNLGLTVVAEGVEDGPTLGRLAELGCDRVQGYYLSRPLPIADFDRLLADEDHLAAICSHLSV